MKNKKLIIIIASIFTLAILGIGLPFLIKFLNDNKFETFIQDLDYSENISDILNPDQGFYRTACVSVFENSVEDKSYIIKNEFQLYHLRMDISTFSGVVNGSEDRELTAEALEGIETLLNKFFERNKNVIVRFSYDKNFDGLSNQEPSEGTILNHISQLCLVLNKFPETITAIEAGMVGPWGEMHTSDLANSETISKIIDKFLKNTTNFPILVRTPQMIYDYLNITLDDIDSYTISNNSLAYRLGIFNDGFLGSDSDLGTYDDREKEIDWISKQTSHLPFGGEVARPSSNLHDIDKCLNEMFAINLSYLNYEWNDEIVQEKWQQQQYVESIGNETLYHGKTAYEYIRNHLGYRLLLTKSEFSYSKKFDKLKISLNLNNIGFGEFYKNKSIFVHFVKENDINSLFVGQFCGEPKINFEVDISSLNGEYEIFVSLESKQNNTSCYQIRFANNLWNESLKANKIGKINIKK